MSTRHRKSLLGLLATGALVAGCGGDNFQNTPDATSEVPASASQSPSGFIEYLRLLVASSADMLEPVDTSMVTPPADDTAEPAAVP
jgi:hypothetical protein